MINDMTRVEVTFHATMKELFGESAKDFALSGTPTLRSLLEILCDSQDRRNRIFDGHGQIRQDATILLNGRNVVFLDGLETVLKNGDKIAVFPPVYGG